MAPIFYKAVYMYPVCSKEVYMSSVCYMEVYISPMCYKEVAHYVLHVVLHVLCTSWRFVCALLQRRGTCIDKNSFTKVKASIHSHQ